jgi:hypothetical protein
MRCTMQSNAPHAISDRLKCCKSIKISGSCADDCMIELTGLIEKEDHNSPLCVRNFSPSFFNCWQPQKLQNPTERYEIDTCLLLLTERRRIDSLKSMALERLRQEIGTVRPDHALKLHCCSKAIFIESSECPECHQCATLCRQVRRNYRWGRCTDTRTEIIGTPIPVPTDFRGPIKNRYGSNMRKRAQNFKIWARKFKFFIANI